MSQQNLTAHLDPARRASQAKDQPKPQQKKDSRQELLRAAKTLFARDGYDGVSVKEIADSASVNVGLIAYYFGSKAGMYRECLTANGEERLAVARRLLFAPESLLEFELRLKLFAEELLESHLKDPEVTTIVHRECERGCSGLAEVDEIFKTTYFEVFRTLQAFLEDGLKKGFLSAQTDPEIATLFFFGQLIHAVRLDTANSKYFGKTVANPEYRKRYIAQLVQIFLLGVTRDEKGARS